MSLKTSTQETVYELCFKTKTSRKQSSLVWKIQANSASWPSCSTTVWWLKYCLRCDWWCHCVKTALSGVNLNLKSVCLWQQQKTKQKKTTTKNCTNPESCEQSFLEMTTPKLCSACYQWFQSRWECCYCSSMICRTQYALLLSTKRSLLYLHTRAASNLICSQTDMQISRE